MRLSRADWAYVDERAADFVGREWIFVQVRAFLAGSGGAFLLCGAPGTGKTAVAARLTQASAGRAVFESRPPSSPIAAGAITAASFCRAGRVDLLDVAQAVSDQLAAAVPGFAQELASALAPEIMIGDVRVETGNVGASASVTGVRIMLDGLGPERAFSRGVAVPLRRLRDAGLTQPIVLLVDGLDEAVSDGRTSLPRLLSALEGIHLIVTTRHDPRVLGHFEAASVRLDLVADAPPGSDDIRKYVVARLQQRGGGEATTVLAERIALEAADNFLYAFHVVDDLTRSGSIGWLDAADAARFALPTGGLPGIYRAFLRRELADDENAWAKRLRPILAPLAVALGDGFDTAQLALIGTRLAGRPIGRSQARGVVRLAAQFLEGPHPDGPFRPYHYSFANFLSDPVQNPDWTIDTQETHEAIVAALLDAIARTDGEGRDWTQADPYHLTHLPSHAARVGRLDELLEDAEFLVAADVGGLLRALPAATASGSRAAREAFQHVADRLHSATQPERASYLEMAARQSADSLLADSIARRHPERPWSVLWAGWHAPSSHFIAGRHSKRDLGGVTAVAVGELGGRQVIVSGGRDGTVSVWDLAEGRSYCEPLTGHDGWVDSVAVSDSPRVPLIVSSSRDGTVRVWDLTDGTSRSHSLDGYMGGETAVAITRLNGRAVVVCCGGFHMRLWNLADGTPYGDPIRTGGVVALAVADVGGFPIAVTGGFHGMLSMWDLAAGAQLGHPLTGHEGIVNSVAVAKRGRPVIVSGGTDGTIRVWTLPAGVPVGKPFRGHQLAVKAVALGEIAGRPVIVSGSEDWTIRVWDLIDGTPYGGPLTGHEYAVETVAVARDDDHSVIVSGGQDGTVRVWELPNSPYVRSAGSADARLPKPSGPRSGADSAEAVGRVTDSSRDRLARPQRLVSAVAVAELDGRPIIISGSHDGTVRVWDLANGASLVHPLIRPDIGRSAVSVGELGDRPVIVYGWPAGMHVSLLADDSPYGHPFALDGVGIWSAAVADLDGRAVIVAGMNDGTVLVWDLEQGRLLGHPLTAHQKGVTAVAVGDLYGRPVIASAGFDWTLRLWDLADGIPLGKPITVQKPAVTALAVGELNGRPVIASSSGYEGVRVWDAETGEDHVIATGSEVMSLALSPDSLIVGTTAGVMVLTISPGAWRKQPGWRTSGTRPVRDITQPRLLGSRYELDDVVGRGELAEIYRARDIRLDRIVAVKTLRDDLAHDQIFQARFRREAQSAASLNHPSIIAVYDTGEDIVRPVPVLYIVMEYVDGRTLRDLLRDDRRLLPERALEIVDGVLRALDYSHRNGIVHRDIKPANVMLTRTGEVKVMGFDIARAPADSQVTMTQSAQVIGTAQYLSPEQARGERVDARSDLYSTGCLMYELVTGRPPFSGDSPAVIAYQQVRENPVPPSHLDPEIPRWADAIVLKAMAKNPADRYQNAADMCADIQRAMSVMLTKVAPPTAAMPGYSHGPEEDPSLGRLRARLWGLFRWRRDE